MHHDDLRPASVYDSESKGEWKTHPASDQFCMGRRFEDETAGVIAGTRHVIKTRWFGCRTTNTNNFTYNFALSHSWPHCR